MMETYQDPRFIAMVVLFLLFSAGIIFYPVYSGLILIAAVLLLPEGLISLPKRIKDWRQGRASLTTEPDKMPMVRDMVKRRKK